MKAIKSPNFGFLADHDPLLLKLASQAEGFCFDEPGVCLVRLRQLTEAMAMEAVSATGGFPKDVAEVFAEDESEPVSRPQIGFSV